MMAIFFIAAAVFVLQWTAVPYACAGPFGFNLQLVTLVFFSVKKGHKSGLCLGLFFGLLNGLLGISAVWANIAVYAAIGFIAGYAARWFYRESLPAFVAMVVVSEAGFCFFNPAGCPASVFAPLLVYNAAAAAFLFYFFKALRVL